MNRILVTGATGFIGKHLVLKLKALGYEVLEANSATGDTASEKYWTGFPKVDTVVHLAGRTFVPDSWANPEAFLHTNLFGTISALNYCRKNNAKLILLSSYLYGNTDILPIPETAELHTHSPYALSKKLAEEVSEFYSNHYGVHSTILRPFNVYGPGQREDFLIPLIIKQVKTQPKVVVKDLEPKRDYVYIEDLVEAICLSIKYEGKFAIFNIGSGESYSVEVLIQIIQELSGTSIPVTSLFERRESEVMDTRADISKASQLLKWKPLWSLREGIKEVLKSI